MVCMELGSPTMCLASVQLSAAAEPSPTQLLATDVVADGTDGTDDDGASASAFGCVAEVAGSGGGGVTETVWRRHGCEAKWGSMRMHLARVELQSSMFSALNSTNAPSPWAIRWHWAPLVACGRNLGCQLACVCTYGRSPQPSQTYPLTSGL